jgi:hypothetical protein
MSNASKRPWSTQDDIDLLTSVEKGLSIGDIASRLGRSETECRMRLDKATRSADSMFPRETAAS